MATNINCRSSIVNKLTEIQLYNHCSDFNRSCQKEVPRPNFDYSSPELLRGKKLEIFLQNTVLKSLTLTAFKHGDVILHLFVACLSFRQSACRVTILVVTP